MSKDPELEGFLALLAARRAPRTVEAYRRDLERLGGVPRRPDLGRDRRPARAVHGGAPRGGAVAGDAGAEDGGRPLLLPAPAAHRRAGRQPGGGGVAAATHQEAAADTVARRGRAADRRGGRHDAASATRPRARRAALRGWPAGLGGDRPREGRRRPRRPRSSASPARAARNASSRSGARRSRRSAATSSRGRPYLDRRHRPELFLNAKGGALTRSGAFLILRRLAEIAGLEDGRVHPAPPPSLVRDAPARGRRRPPQRPGDARPRRPQHDGALHARHRPAAAGDVLPGPPARAREDLARRPGLAAQRLGDLPRGVAQLAALPRRPRRARPGSGSCRAAASRSAAHITASRRTASLRSRETSSWRSGRTPLTTPGWSRESSSSEMSAEPRQAGLSSSRPRRSSSTFCRKRNCPIARYATARSR